MRLILGGDLLADVGSTTGGVALGIAAFGFLGVTVAPVVLALINRGGKSKAVAPEVAVPRTEYDNLLDQLARLDDENDRLARESTRLSGELKDEQLARLRCEIERDNALRDLDDLRRRKRSPR